MYYYRAYGLKCISDTLIGAFIPIEATNDIDLSIRFKRSPDYVLEEQKESKKCYGKSADVFWFRNKYATFTIEHGKRIIVDTDIHQHTATLFVLGYCMSILFYQRGKIALHGSGLVHNNKTIIIAGHSGAGKSSLTSEFINDGATFLVDDISVINIDNGEPMLISGFPNQHLCKDLMLTNGYDFKKAVEIDEDREKYRYSRMNCFEDSQHKLDCIIYLEQYKGEDVQVRRLNDSERLKYFTKHIFSRRILGRMGLSEWVMLDTLEIAKSTQALLVRRPRKRMSVAIQKEEISNFLQ